VNNFGFWFTVNLLLSHLEKDQYSYGFDSQTGEYGNLVSKGIIDPTKVVRVAIQNAASVAALLITTEAMVFRRRTQVLAACLRAEAAWAELVWPFDDRGRLMFGILILTRRPSSNLIPNNLGR
jgi:hypothetical protein